MAKRARMKSGQLKVPVTKNPRAEPTRIGETLAVRNFGLVARKRFIAFEFRVINSYLKRYLKNSKWIIAVGSAKSQHAAGVCRFAE